VIRVAVASISNNAPSNGACSFSEIIVNFPVAACVEKDNKKAV